MRAMRFKELPPERRYGDKGSAALLILTLHEASVIGILPNGKARARRAPCVDDFRVGSWLRTDPFEKIENQRVYGIGQGRAPLVRVIGSWQLGKGNSGRPTQRRDGLWAAKRTGFIPMLDLRPAIPTQALYLPRDCAIARLASSAIALASGVENGK